MEMIIKEFTATDPIIAMITGSLITVILASMVFFASIKYLLTAAGYYKMFGKAGIPGWKAFIPLYSDFSKYQLAWSGKMFFLTMAMVLGNAVFCSMDSTVAQLISIPMGITAIVMMVKQELKMAKCFGKGAGFAILQLFFPFIAAPILGFGKAEYQAADPANAAA